MKREIRSPNSSYWSATGHNLIGSKEIKIAYLVRGCFRKKIAIDPFFGKGSMPTMVQNPNLNIDCAIALKITGRFHLNHKSLADCFKKEVQHGFLERFN